eukprot:GHVN01098498.1.p1 GENE.GHVN01098498.1~~GHVN01098498.1.p1  ORF type:complete len:457 (+),score=120.66 GHVN01098498.1:40-1410(+)
MAKNEVAALIEVVAREELNKTGDQVKPFIKILVEDNWIDTIDALKSLTAEQWSSLKLPIRLESALKERLNTPQTRLTQAICRVRGDESTPEKQGRDLSAVEAFRPSEMMDTDLLTPLTLWVSEVKANDTPHALGSALRTLTRLVTGVLNEQGDPAKRRIRRGNQAFHSTFGRYESSLEVMRAIGFEETDDGFLELPVAYLSVLNECYDHLCSIAEANGIPLTSLPSPHGFNPFASSISSTNAPYWKVAEGAIQKRAAEASAREQEASEVKRKLKEGTKSTVPLNARTFSLSELPAVEAKRRHNLNLSNAAHSGDGGDEEMTAPPPSESDLQRIKELLSDGPKFKSRSKEEYNKLKNRKIFDESVLRVFFPDKMILEMSFPPKAKVEEIVNQIPQFLTDECSSRKFILFQAPPYRKLDLKKTLFEEGLVPLAQIHFQLQDESITVKQYLKPILNERQ